MTYGFQVQNSNGETIADDSSFSLVEVASGTVTTGAGVGGTITYPDYGQIPIIMVQTPSGSGRVTMTSQSNTETGVNIFDGAGSVPALSRVAATMNYRVFQRSNVAPVGSGDYGILLFNAAGDVTFDSRQTPMQLHSVVAVSTPVAAESTSLTVFSTTLPSGLSASSWFQLIGGNAAGFQQTSGGTPPSNVVYCHAVRIAGTSLQIAYVQLTVGVGGSQAWTVGRSFFLTN